MSFVGQVLNQKRRLVVRRDLVGNPPPGQVTAVRGFRGPSGSGEPVAHARGRRTVRVPVAPGVQPGHLRPDARMLEETGIGPADVPGDPPVLAAQKPGIRAGRFMTVERRWQAVRAVYFPGKRILSATSQRYQLINVRHDHDAHTAYLAEDDNRNTRPFLPSDRTPKSRREHNILLVNRFDNLIFFSTRKFNNSDYC